MKKAILITGISLAACALAAFVVLNAGNIMFLIMMGNMGSKTVVQTLPSPEGGYEARVINVDQGALGGDTVVEVQKNDWKARTEQIYIGEWGEFETMEIYWKDEHSLVINGKEYQVD